MDRRVSALDFSQKSYGEQVPVGPVVHLVRTVEQGTSPASFKEVKGIEDESGATPIGPVAPAEEAQT
jgi:hypothetical protein